MADTAAERSGGAGGNVFTVPPGRPFLDSVARAILAGDLPRPGGTAPDPLELPRITLLLPTRRACRAMPAAFLCASGGEASLLPRIRPLAEADEEASLLQSLARADSLGSEGARTLALPPAVGEIERRLVLSLLVLQWSRMVADEGADGALGGGPAGTPAQAAHLATELAHLMDTLEAEQADLSRLSDLVRPDLSAHWQQTLDFLSIITDTWPAYLAERGLLSPVARRARLLAEEARRLADEGEGAGPVIIAGIAASQPIMRPIIEAVVGHPRGALVLPGLDRHLDEQSWQALATEHPEHPQHGMARLLDELAIARSAVRPLPGAEPDGPAEARAQLLSEAMRPAETTPLWPAFVHGAPREAIRQALAGVTRLDAPTAQDEAEAIALILRRAVESPDRTAALVTPDRVLARRVAARLACWGLHVDDSAGRPFAKTAPGAFLDLVVSAFEEDFSPRSVVALLNHPLTRLGLAPGTVRGAARALDLALFRTPYLGRGLEGLAESLEGIAAARDERAPHPAIRRARTLRLEAARDLVARLKDAYVPLMALAGEDAASKHAALRHPLRAFAAAHVAVAEALAADEAGASDGLWAGPGGEAASAFFAGLMDETIRHPELAAEDYPGFYRALVAREVVRLGQPLHPRLFIWGPREARLLSADVLVLGGLNEGVWPRIAEPDPWLSRPMRARLGLSAPEARIGLAAHDFCQLFAGREVYLTRAAKVDGVPSVPSRWLMRLATLLAGLGLEDALEPADDTPWLAWARARDHVPAVRTIAPPAPRPPVAARPRKLSVTRIESWIANPYAIFARHILHLEALPPLGKQPDAALRGQILHRAMHLFASRYPTSLPDDIAGALMEIIEHVLAEHAAHPRVATFWRRRLARFAAWFAETEPARRAPAQAPAVRRSLAEIHGERELAARAGPFTLTARADRIDLTEDGGAVIYDYKTGTPPPVTRVTHLLAPQLPLEAAIALAGGFAGLQPRAIAGLAYIRASGGTPPGEEKIVDLQDFDGNFDDLANEALEALAALVNAFDREETPYAAIRRRGAAFAAHYRLDDYAHLARVDEWSAAPARERGVPA